MYAYVEADHYFKQNKAKQNVLSDHEKLKSKGKENAKESRHRMTNWQNWLSQNQRRES